jgi:ribonuclease BN (tRNA processing enzyme)
VLDLGTGLRPLGLELDAGGAADNGIHLTAFLSHLHWDHIIGLPFFPTVHHPSTTLDIYGPPQQGGSLHDVFERVLHPPFFPISVEGLRGDVRLKEALDEDVIVGNAKVVVRQVPHVGTTLGFRIEAGGAAVAFISDHQQPHDPNHVDENVLELCDGADLVIHDAQYTQEEFQMKSDWGHSTISYAVHVAREAGARQLALFHHDPLHMDDDIDRLLAEARSMEDASHLDKVLAASEGLSLEVRPSVSGHRVTTPRYVSNDHALRGLLDPEQNGAFGNGTTVPGGWSLIEQLRAARTGAPATRNHAAPGA